MNGSKWRLLNRENKLCWLCAEDSDWLIDWPVWLLLIANNKTLREGNLYQQEPEREDKELRLVLMVRFLVLWLSFCSCAVRSFTGVQLVRFTCQSKALKVGTSSHRQTKPTKINFEQDGNATNEGRCIISKSSRFLWTWSVPHCPAKAFFFFCLTFGLFACGHCSADISRENPRRC